MLSSGQLTEVAEKLNDRFGTKIEWHDVDDFVTSDDLLEEIKEGTYTDTDIMEAMIDAIAEGMIGMHFPVNGDTKQYKDAFDNKAKSAGLI